MTNQQWVKKLISKSQWNNWYSKNSSYCKLKEDVEGLWIGFLVANEVPYDCIKMTDYELIQVDDYRRANNIAPYPLLNKIEKPKQKASKTTLEALDKLKKHIKSISNKMSVRLEDNPIQEPEDTEEEAKRRVVLESIPF